MAKNRKISFKTYPAWGYEKEIEDLDRASEQGWQLVRGGCFHSSFVKNPKLRYRYQMDCRRVDDMGRYIETFREQGWEYLNSTYNNWHYFRKAWDPALPEEAYEIFTDRESLKEMNGGLVRLMLALGIVAGLFAVIYGVQLIRRPTIPALLQVLVFLVETGVILRGAWILSRPDARQRKRGGGRFAVVFLGVLLAGVTAMMILQSLRPGFDTAQQASGVDAPVSDKHWADFEIKYPDNYYLDLDFASETPMTFSILNAAGEPVYTKTGVSFQEDDICLRLPVGRYCFSISYEAGFRVKCKMR